MLHQLQLLLWFACCLQLLPAARVYMELNGQRMEYNTDGQRSGYQQQQLLYPTYERVESEQWPRSSLGQQQLLSPNYAALESEQWPPRNSNRPRHNYNPEWSWRGAALEERSPSHYNINMQTPQMTHTQHTDAAGHVIGKYSYYDDAGYHELSYKAGAGIGFVVMGGNLAKPTVEA